MDKHVVKINVDIVLKGEDAKFFNMLCDMNKKEGNFTSVKDFVEFLFMAGFTFIRGHFIGSMTAGLMKTVLPMLVASTNQQEQEEDSSIMFDKAFLNGEPADYQITDDGQELHIRYRFGPNKNTWQRIYLLKQNKPLQWKGDNI